MSVVESPELDALRAGDEAAFLALVRRHQTAMVRVAQIYVSRKDIAEEVVQEAWLGVLRGLDRFEGRSSFKTWLLRIVTNLAKTRAVREGRTIPFSALRSPESVPEPAVEPERFRRPDDPRWPGHWASKPSEWPEQRLLGDETLQRIQAAIEALPDNQRAVITLRDVEGWSAEEVCNALELSETNQRVLLHRARSKVRGALERYFDE
ncbi:MAG TPA: sigma-70 family RNA polymerase sigma factor [Gaiellaceae bacterium]|nr:sigma-70 family RNA polymerase sigma factor [Gaiellaceae bacterium]